LSGFINPTTQNIDHHHVLTLEVIDQKQISPIAKSYRIQHVGRPRSLNASISALLQIGNDYDVGARHNVRNFNADA
jgi:hypothetical protein